MKYKVIIIGGIALIIIVGIVAFLFGRPSADGSLSGTLKIWGFEEPLVWGEVMSAFEGQYKKVKISYTQKTEENYETELLNALAAGQGPDIFPIHHTWLNKHIDKLAPFPQTFLGPQEFSLTFVDVASKDLIRGASVYAVPFYVDTLALYYNKKIFNATGIVFPPKTWEEFNEAVIKTAQISESGTILRSGAAIGAAFNVNHASDLLSSIMLQTGAVMIDPSTGRAVFDKEVSLNGEAYSPGEAALQFYTDFSNPTASVYTWNRRLADSLASFINGDAAMYFGYARDMGAIKDSDISFAVAPLPQVKDQSKDPSYLDLNYAKYWAGSVNKLSRNREVAWTFLRFATSRNVLFNFLTKSALPTSRRDLIQVQSAEVNSAVFAKQTLTADSWMQPDFEKINNLFNQMIDNVVLGKLSAEESVRDTAKAVDNL